MAKQQQDKEDILREATALVNRVELQSFQDTDSPQSVFVGFRRDGAISFFFDTEPVYQFNSRHAFRRGYYQNTILKAEQGKIVQLVRTRKGEQLILLRRDYSDQQTVAFVQEMQQNLLELYSYLQSEQYRIVGAVVQQGTEQDLVSQIAVWIKKHASEIQIAEAANVAG
ncbi:MAG: hypothetical protein CMJ76_15865 [Planctomycetaceae bacterium]|nr:hypothetical protein [Planctomycetaceae bacterium]